MNCTFRYKVFSVFSSYSTFKPKGVGVRGVGTNRQSSFHLDIMVKCSQMRFSWLWSNLKCICIFVYLQSSINKFLRECQHFPLFACSEGSYYFFRSTVSFTMMVALMLPVHGLVLDFRLYFMHSDLLSCTGSAFSLFHGPWIDANNNPFKAIWPKHVHTSYSAPLFSWIMSMKHKEESKVQYHLNTTPAWQPT